MGEYLKNGGFINNFSKVNNANNKLIVDKGYFTIVLEYVTILVINNYRGTAS